MRSWSDALKLVSSPYNTAYVIIVIIYGRPRVPSCNTATRRLQTSQAWRHVLTWPTVPLFLTTIILRPMPSTTTLCALDEKISVLGAEVLRLKRCRNTLIPICRLPPQLPFRIFLHLQQRDTRHTDHDYDFNISHNTFFKLRYGHMSPTDSDEHRTREAL
jgi:hypothetical protein